MSKLHHYLEMAKKKKEPAKKIHDEDVKQAIDDFAAEIAKKPKSKQESWADTAGYKKYGHIFDALSDADHNRAMDAMWKIVADFNKS